MGDAEASLRVARGSRWVGAGALRPLPAAVGELPIHSAGYGAHSHQRGCRDPQ